MLYGIIKNRLFHFNTLMSSITTMENLMFGATLNTDGSLRKIHIVRHGKKIICKKNHFHQEFVAAKVYTFDTVPKTIVFCRGCAKKSKCIKSILQHFKLTTNFYTKNKKKRIMYEDHKSNENDSGYIPSPVRKRKRYQYNNSHRETKKAPVPEEKKWDIYHEGRICYYCQKQMRTQFVIHGSNIFHNNCCLLFFLNEEKQPSFDTSIYKHPESENLTFIQ